MIGTDAVICGVVMLLFASVVSTGCEVVTTPTLLRSSRAPVKLTTPVPVPVEPVVPLPASPVGLKMRSVTRACSPGASATVVFWMSGFWMSGFTTFANCCGFDGSVNAGLLMLATVRFWPGCTTVH